MSDNVSDERSWSAATWDGNRRRQHAEFRALPLREKWAIVEQMGEVVERLARRDATRSADTPRRPSE